MPLESGRLRPTRPWGKAYLAFLRVAESLRHRRQRERNPTVLNLHASGAIAGVRLVRETTFTFAARHIGPDADAIATMLATIGVGSLDELADKALPAGILDSLTADQVAPGLDQLPPAATEDEALAELRALADANTVAVSMIGQGYFDTLTPPVLRRNILESPAWYTAYTPYQPEISQGRLEALLNFQTMVCDLTGLEVANASMLDEGTAAAEAMTLMHRAVRGSSNRLVVDRDVYPQTAAVLATRAQPLGIEIVEADLAARPARRRVLRGHRPVAGRRRRHRRLERHGRAGARPWCAGRHRRRPARHDAHHAARRDRSRRRIRQHPEIRRANGIRGTARRLSRRARQARQTTARPPRGSVARRRRRPGVPAGAADPRTAHPAGQGDKQYLHRAGAAGGDGGDVRELSRCRRVDRDRAAGASAMPARWPRG